MIKIVIKFTYNFQENHHFRKKKKRIFLTMEGEGMEMSCRKGI